MSHDLPDCHARPFHVPESSSLDAVSGSSGESFPGVALSGATGAEVAIGTDTYFGPMVHAQQIDAKTSARLIKRPRGGARSRSRSRRARASEGHARRAGASRARRRE